MKKKFLSILLALAMVVSLLPAKVQAKETPETEPNYFCITNTSDEVATVTWTCENPQKNLADMKLDYRIGDGDWETDSPTFSVEVPAYTSVYFRKHGEGVGTFSKYDDGFYVNYDEYGNIIDGDDAFYSIYCNKPHTASGDITTLLRENGNVTDLTELGEAGKYVFASLFSGDKFLTSAEDLILPSEKLTPYCYFDMFWRCEALEKAPELPAKTLADSCYDHMFAGCFRLTTAPELPAKTLADACYARMFDGCESLTIAPELPAETLADSCYESMFGGCVSLTTAPELPAETLADSCYDSMFDRCESLTIAPELPAETLADSCYCSMFENCFNLTTAPELPAKTLADSCYCSMFENCFNLTTAPELPAETLADFCYSGMFMNCYNLTTAPELPAETLVDFCYYCMFQYCQSLNHITMLATDISADYCLDGWVSNVASTGTFTKSAQMTDLTTGTSVIPEGWSVYTEEDNKQVSISTDIENGTVTVDKKKAVPGETVTLTVTPDEGYKLKSLNVKAGETTIDITADYTFAMPAGDVTVTAEFEEIYSIYITGDIENGTVIADKATAAPGETVTLTVTPYEGYELEKLYITAGWDDIEVTDNTFTMPAATVDIRVYFRKIYNINIINSDGGTVLANKFIADENDSVTLTAIPDSGYDFVRWESDDVVIDNDSFTMPAYDVDIKAVFAVPYTITVAADENGIASADMTTAYVDDVITLSAKPNSGYNFIGWESDDVTVEGNTFTMPAKNVSVKAIFEPVTLVSSVAYRYPVTDGKNVVSNDDGTVKFADGNQSTCTLVDGKTILWTEGWYVVTGKIDIDERITVSGNVNLILSDGCELNANSGITVSGEENSLTIYGQSAGTGTLNAVNIGMNGAAGIGGEKGCNGNNITINGGVIVAGYPSGENVEDAAGIGGGHGADGINITINGGNVLAYGSISSAGIGGATEGDGKDITINGGTVYAKGSAGHGAAGIGSGGDGEGSDISINGGKVTAVGRIGIGGDLGSENIVIKNSIVKAGADAANATTISADVVTEKELNNAAYVIIEPNPAKNNGSQGTGSSTGDNHGSGYPQGNTDVHGSGSQGTGSSTDVPESGSQGTGSSTDVPGSGSQGTGSSTDVPGSGSQGTGSSTDVPGSESQGTGSSTDVPESGSQGTVNTEDPEAGNTESGKDEGSENAAPAAETLPEEEINEIVEGVKNLTDDTFKGVKAYTAAAENSINEPEKITHRDGGYYDKNGEKVTDTFISTKKGVKFVGADGKTVRRSLVNVVDPVTGKVTKYYATKNGTIAKNRLITLTDGTRIFTKEDGSVAANEIVTNPATGRQYYADENGAILRNSVVVVDGKKYYTNKYGVIKKNALVTDADGVRHFCGPDGAFVKNEWVLVGKKEYWCNKKGNITKDRDVK